MSDTLDKLGRYEEAESARKRVRELECT